LILLDIQLPGMDATRSPARSKDDPQLRHIPVVAVTSYAMVDRKNALLPARKLYRETDQPRFVRGEMNDFSRRPERMLLYDCVLTWTTSRTTFTCCALCCAAMVRRGGARTPPSAGEKRGRRAHTHHSDLLMPVWMAISLLNTLEGE